MLRNAYCKRKDYSISLLALITSYQVITYLLAKNNNEIIIMKE